jgi:hypothetical protein
MSHELVNNVKSIVATEGTPNYSETFLAKCCDCNDPVQLFLKNGKHFIIDSETMDYELGQYYDNKILCRYAGMGWCEYLCLYCSDKSKLRITEIIRNQDNDETSHNETTCYRVLEVGMGTIPSIPWPQNSQENDQGCFKFFDTKEDAIATIS